MNFLRLRLGVIEGFVTDAAGESGVTGDGDDVLVTAAKVSADGHAERGRKRGARVAGAVTIVLALGAEKEPVQALVLAHGRDPIEPAGKHLVHVTLVADVEDKAVLRRVEDAMQSDR